MSDKETISVSKGVFVFKNGFKRPKRQKKTTQVRLIDNMFSLNLWYQEYEKLWSILDEDFENLTSQMFTSMTTDLMDYIKTSHDNFVSEIPTAALLTGINMPDHESQFKTLEKLLKSQITPHIAFLKSQDCPNLKYLIYNMINQFVNETDYSEEEEEEQSKLKKSNLSLPLLQSWYEDLYSENGKLLVVIIPDFESFDVRVLQGFILIVSSYLQSLPFVFVFGIATCINTLHSSFPYHVTSKTNIRVFKCEPSTVHLNKMLEGVFLKPFCPFQLGGKVFNLFTEMFLYYDFSVRNFVQNIKYAMMEHFCYGNAMALCQIEKKEVRDVLRIFNHEDCESVRRLMSFRKLVESEPYENRIHLLTDDDYLKICLQEKTVAIQRYIKRLHIFLKCLHVISSDLPGAPLGKNLREVYALSVSKSIVTSQEYKEAFQLLNFQSKEELSQKLQKIIFILREFINEDSRKNQLKDFFSQIIQYTETLQNLESLSPDLEVDEMEFEEDLGQVMDRKALKEALLLRSKNKIKPLNKYEQLRKEILQFLMDNFQLYLHHYSTLPLHEIFFFDDISIKDKIIGSHRSAIHNALNDPHFYLQCKCCEVSNNQAFKATMPDICIAYKLHLEYGKMINLYDWLQAFLYIVDPKEDDDFDDTSKKVVDPQLQAKFTQAVAELEYLGFIKSSKRKADHVMRLTWEG